MTVTANDRTAEGYQFGGWYVDSMNASLDDAAAMDTFYYAGCRCDADRNLHCDPDRRT